MRPPCLPATRDAKCPEVCSRLCLQMMKYNQKVWLRSFAACRQRLRRHSATTCAVLAVEILATKMRPANWLHLRLPSRATVTFTRSQEYSPPIVLGALYTSLERRSTRPFLLQQHAQLASILQSTLTGRLFLTVYSTGHFLLQDRHHGRHCPCCGRGRHQEPRQA